MKKRRKCLLKSRKNKQNIIFQSCRTSEKLFSQSHLHFYLTFEGYTGLLCTSDVDECLSQPCKNNATCINKVNPYKYIVNCFY